MEPDRWEAPELAGVTPEADFLATADPADFDRALAAHVNRPISPYPAGEAVDPWARPPATRPALRLVRRAVAFITLAVVAVAIPYATVSVVLGWTR